MHLLHPADRRSFMVHMRNVQTKIMSFSSQMKRSDLHLSESQRVLVASPCLPHHTVSERRVATSQV